MVIAQEVQEAVDHQSFQFFIEKNAVFGSLSLCLMEIDDDVTERKIVIRDSRCANVGG